jgi:hypothetical protein
MLQHRTGEARPTTPDPATGPGGPAGAAPALVTLATLAAPDHRPGRKVPGFLTGDVTRR